MPVYKTIKRDSTFPITIGGNTLINFQKLLLYVIADKSEEEILTAQEKILKQEFTEDWYEHVAFLSLMITAIERTAQEKGLLIEENLDDQSTTPES